MSCWHPFCQPSKGRTAPHSAERQPGPRADGDTPQLHVLGQKVQKKSLQKHAFGNTLNLHVLVPLLSKDAFPLRGKPNVLDTGEYPLVLIITPSQNINKISHK